MVHPAIDKFREMGSFSILSPLLLLAAQAGADEPAAAPEGNDTEIIVSGTKQEIRNELRTVLNETSDQLARYEGKFCPVIMGLGEDLTPRFKKLLIENATDAGLDVAEAPCAATALVIFIDEPQELAVALRKKYHRIYGQMPPRQRDRLLEPERSHYTWQVFRTLNRHGEAPAAAISQGSDGWEVPVIRGKTDSRIYFPTTKDIAMSFLIVDIDKIEGATLGQLADFAALNLMLPVQFDAYEDARADSMLRLLEADDPTTMPPRMTSFDKRLLSGLYHLQTNALRGAVQRGRLASYIKEGEAAGIDEQDE